jgi:hypothetical protein
VLVNKSYAVLAPTKSAFGANSWKKLDAMMTDAGKVATGLVYIYTLKPL